MTIHHLCVTASACRAALRVNGFPLGEISLAGAQRELSPPINPYLVGTGNRVEVEILPPPETSGQALLGQGRVSGSVRRYAKGDVAIQQLALPVSCLVCLHACLFVAPSFVCLGWDRLAGAGG
jgi:hypothetical protein